MGKIFLPLEKAATNLANKIRNAVLCTNPHPPTCSYIVNCFIHILTHEFAHQCIYTTIHLFIQTFCMSAFTKVALGQYPKHNGLDNINCLSVLEVGVKGLAELVLLRAVSKSSFMCLPYWQSAVPCLAEASPDCGLHLHTSFSVYLCV